MFKKGIIQFGGVAPSYFISEWTVSGDITARTITLPVSSATLLHADWGDGVVNTGISTHTFASDGIYQVKLWGTIESWAFNNGGDRLKITNIINWGESPGVTFTGLMQNSFYGCSNLKTLGSSGSIPLVAGLNTFQAAFKNCTSLNSLPATLFSNFTTGYSGSIFRETFSGCSSLTTIPGTLFQLSVPTGTANTYIFYQTFYNCTSLQTIGSGLFDGKPNLTDYCFTYIFGNCFALNNLPTDLFRYCPSVNLAGFNYAFDQCRSLTSLPNNLFDYNTVAKTFAGTFRGCTNLATVPLYLFRYNTGPAGQPSGFASTFQNCNKLQQNEWIFYAPGEEATRFLMAYDFSNCFNRLSFTGIQGKAPELWLYATSGSIKTACFRGAGNSLASLSNYASIPALWK